MRQARKEDRRAIAAVVDEWWGGRPMRGLLQPLFLEHFAQTSLIAEDAGEMVGFLVGFCSADRADEAYVHFVGVHPDRRRQGIGDALHDRFAEQVAAHGVRVVRCVTSTVNAASVRFHTAIGFGVDGRDEIDDDGGDARVRMSRAVDVAEPRFVVRIDERPDDPGFPSTAEHAWPLPRGTVLSGGTVELTVTDPDGDADGLFGALDSDAVWAHLYGRPGDAAGMAELMARRAATSGWCPWTVRLSRPLRGRDSGAVIGTTSFLDVVPLDARGEIGATMYDETLWASDVNPECKLLLMSHAFDVLGWGRVQLKTDVRNHRSQRAIARLGARYEGVLRRYQRRSDGTVRDTVLFAVTVDDWPRVRAGLERRLARQSEAS